MIRSISAASRAWREVLAIGILCLLGALSLNYPFTGDQALFTLGATKIQHGGILYRDFWDLKQPGIFIFYFVAGRLFGFSEVGVHAFELLYFVCFAVMLQLTLPAYIQNRWITAFSPILVIGTYYATATPWFLTQVEALIGPALYSSLWFCYAASRSQGRRRLGLLFCSGLAAAFVVLFKLIYLPVLAAALVAIVLAARGSLKEPSSMKVWIPLCAFASGLLLPLMLLWAIYAPVIGAAQLYDTFVTIPSRIVAELPQPSIRRIVSSARWFILNCGLLTCLAVIGSQGDLRTRKSPITYAMLAWLAAGVIAFLMQRQSWWPYQVMLFIVPIGVLALRGVELIVDWLRAPKSTSGLRMRPLAVPLVAILLLLAVGTVPAFSKARRLLAVVNRGQANSTQRFQFELEPMYREANAETAFLRDRNQPGELYVCGDPIYYIFARRNQPIALNGWGLELLLPLQWEELRSELAAKRPRYIFVARDYQDLIKDRSPETMALIRQNYRERSGDSNGAWYELRRV